MRVQGSGFRGWDQLRAKFKLEGSQRLELGVGRFKLRAKLLLFVHRSSRSAIPLRPVMV